MNPPTSARIELLCEKIGAPGVVVHVFDQCVFDGNATTCLFVIGIGSIEGFIDFPARVHRDELITQFVIGGVQGEGKRQLQTFVCQLVNSGGESH